MEHHGYGRVLAIELDGVTDVLRAPDLVLDGTVREVGPASHEGVSEVRSLQDHGAAEHLVHLDSSLGLAHRVDVERPLRVAVAPGGVENGFERNEWHRNQAPLHPAGGAGAFQ